MARVLTGVTGLDEILRGGLVGESVNLIEGESGSGKTTLALMFLMAGAARKQRALYIAFSETEKEIRRMAKSHGWDLAGVKIEVISPGDETFSAADDYTFFEPSEVELGVTTQAIFEACQSIRAELVVIDALSGMRLLAQDAMRFRRQMLALKHFFDRIACTVLLIDDQKSAQDDLPLQSLVSGVIQLEHFSPEYGKSHRRLEVKKMRDVDFISGKHDYEIARGGMTVFPRLVPGLRRNAHCEEQFTSGNEVLDSLLGGGIRRTGTTLIVGPEGAGKSSLITHVAAAALKRREAVSVFSFDEQIESYRQRYRSFMSIADESIDDYPLKLRMINPSQVSAGEFDWLVRQSVVNDGAKILVIDTLNGYFQSMPDERYLDLHLQELLEFLSQNQVAAIVAVSPLALLKGHEQFSTTFFRLADTTINLRFFEEGNTTQKAVSIAKKRNSSIDTSLYEFVIRSEGVAVGRKLSE